VRLFTHCHEQMALQGLNRPPTGCKSYWCRYGRLRSRFEERDVPPGTSLVSSAQKPKGKDKRAKGSKPPAKKRNSPKKKK